MSRTSGTHQIIRAVADGTGRTEEEVWLKVASTVVVASLIGFFHVVEVVTDLAADLNRMAHQ